MPAYVIAETEVHDPEQYERDKAVARAPSPYSRATGSQRGLSLLEFADLDAARRWYDSPEYREARRLREGAASPHVAVEGL